MLAGIYYDRSVGLHVRQLRQLAAVLKKGTEWADEQQVPHKQLIEARLAPDMLQLPFQVWAACRTARTIIGEASLTSLGPPPQVEGATFSGLRHLIEDTLEQLHTVDPGSFEGKAHSNIVVPNGDKSEFRVAAPAYMVTYGIPNFEFHVTTAYLTLRSQGVPIGKLDFLGPRKEFLIEHAREAAQ